MVFADSNNDVQSWTITAGTSAVTCSQGTIKDDAWPARSTTGAGAATAVAAWSPTPSGPRDWPASGPGDRRAQRVLFVWHMTTSGNPPQAEVRIPEIPEYAGG